MKNSSYVIHPYLELNRAEWSKLRSSTPSNITEKDLEHLRGLGESLDLLEIADIYLPLARLIHLQVVASRSLYHASATFLGKKSDSERVPFILGIAGSVAVGKSTTARVLQTLLSQWPEHKNVALVTTDGFLYPNEELEQRNLMDFKGFPESFNTKALLKFVIDLKSGLEHVTAPVYSHISYDIVPNELIHVYKPDIVILEGLNVLQTAPRLMVSDFFDFSIYVDARIRDIESWYIARFLQLKNKAFNKENSFFKNFAKLTDAELTECATSIWQKINRPNLVKNILPTRPRATLVLRKNEDHSIYRVRLRKG